MDDLSNYAHSQVHIAILHQDYTGLTRIIESLPKLAKPGEVTNEADSILAELKANKLSDVLDKRDVPGRETPLHLAIRLRDAKSAEILMLAGANWSLQNENGWNALQEAVCNKVEQISLIIARNYQPLAWAKWCRRLPRIIATMSRIRDFYMEISFNFESSVIPFIGRIAPSDTYRIWKRGSNLRADMTLAGFDGFRIQRSDQTFLFLGEGNLCLPKGSLIVLSHKKKEIVNALEGAGCQPSENEVKREVALMCETNLYRPGIDVTRAEVVPHLNWRRQERCEMVGKWKAKVFDMVNVMVSVKSRRVPGALTDEEVFSVDDCEKVVKGADQVDFGAITDEERKQLDSVLRMGNSSEGVGEGEHSSEVAFENGESNGKGKEKKSWFGSKTKSSKNGNKISIDAQMDYDVGSAKKGKAKSSMKDGKKGVLSEFKHESEFKKGLRPVLWLTSDFPLQTEELLPLLDILADKVKAVRRLRELLTTKLPPGTFPVKVAIPIAPTVKVVVTFTKFEEFQPTEEFVTPPSSPTHFQDSNSKPPDGSTSWVSWMKGTRGGPSSDEDSPSHHYTDETDPFSIPADYTWVDATEKKRRMNARKAKNKKNHKPTPGF